MKTWVGVLLLVLVPSLAGAQVITFDDLPAGTAVGAQYHAQGLDFLTALPGHPGTSADLPTVVAAATTSPPQAASLRLPGCAGEFCSNVAFGQFGEAKSFISVQVGDLSTLGTPVDVTLVAYRADGSEAASSTVTVASGAGVGTWLLVASAATDIWFFELSAPLNSHAAFDDLAFDSPSAPSPDFTLTWTALLPVPVERGGAVTTAVRVNRLGGSTGPITFSASGLPPALSASFSPNPFTGADGETVTVTLSALVVALPGSGTFSVTGTPGAGAGSAPRSASVAYTVLDGFDAELAGIEVTQGIQALDLPRRSADPAAPVPYAGGTLDGSGQPLSDQGVPLVQDSRTVVRVWADYLMPPLFSALPALSVTLQVCDASGAACSAPLSPVSSSNRTSLASLLGSGFVTDAQRVDPQSAFNFVLPRSATFGTISLKATVYPELGLGAPSHECATPACAANNTFLLTGVTFTPTHDVPVLPIELRIHGSRVVAPDVAFRVPQDLTPVASGGLLAPSAYMGEIDISDIYDFPTSVLTTLIPWETPDSVRGGWVAMRLLERADDWSDLDATDGPVVGLMPDDSAVEGAIRGQQFAYKGCTGPWYDCDWADGQVAIAYAPDQFGFTLPGGGGETPRPRTSTTHELFHMLGRAHASDACTDPGSGGTEPWPGANDGRIYGFGLNRLGSSGAALPPGVFDIYPPDRTGRVPTYYDIMGYCGGGMEFGSNGVVFTPFDLAHWNSVKGWGELVGTLAVAPTPAPAPLALRGHGHGAPGASGADLLTVRAMAGEQGQAVLVSVGQTRDLGLVAAPAADFHVVARSGTGAVLADVPMADWAGHAHPGGDGHLLTAQLAGAGVERVELTFQGQVLDHRDRPAQAPVVHLRSPGHSLGRGDAEVRVRWSTRASGPTTVKIDYAAEAGHWRPLFAGPDTGEARLPASYFAGAQCGQLRVRVNDGFNEVSDTSGCLRVEHRPPVVRITSPAAGERFPASAPTLFTGAASDESGRAIPASSLRWRLDRQPLDTGRSATVQGLAAGCSTLSLEATDAAGRRGQARVSLACGRGPGATCRVARRGCGCGRPDEDGEDDD